MAKSDRVFVGIIFLFIFGRLVDGLPAQLGWNGAWGLLALFFYLPMFYLIEKAVTKAYVIPATPVEVKE